ncbi:S10 family peptidase [Robertkochia solimangrovi]|uniref:S10 family peptidase n=1 Tax=Robertkochia solimangrovi TaxID=2213046 RepID=UPI00117E5EE5|nr:carboxypeptidase [Robertkochia solimangrovi]TRZ45333.1 carboxypeptidase [Robertkochia solimangrovi]
MTKLSTLFVMMCLSVTCLVSAQKQVVLPADSIVTTAHQVVIKGKKVSYNTDTGTIPVWDKDGNPIAALYHTYYYRTDVSNNVDRPLLISFNGGPGSASVWMHIAYTGPKVLNIDDEGYPVQPYGVKDNPNSILDIADIVYVNPVNTGYSRMLAGKDGKMPDRKQFFGIRQDISYLADWITTFVTRNNRWRSPKYIIGESYGGTRVAGLALALQERQWMYLNGVIMVSPADYTVYNSAGPVGDASNLPYFTAAAWYHKKLSPELQARDLTDILPEAESFAVNSLVPALTKGGNISDQERNQVASKMAYYSGISEKSILDHNLSVPTSFFWKELLRQEGKTIGRLDSRYLGIDRQNAGTRPDYNAELTSWLHSFTPAINYYLQEELKFKTDLKYFMFGPVHPWDMDNENTREDLRQAMAQNPYLNVMFQSGYFDGATTYFSAKMTMWQLDPSGTLQDRMSFKGYRSGHMMYLRNEDLQTANDDLRNFINSTLTKGESAKY